MFTRASEYSIGIFSLGGCGRKGGEDLNMGWLARHLVGVSLVILVLLPLTLIILYRFVPPPITPLMLLRGADGKSSNYRWRSLDFISPDLPAMVIAAEDNRFCEHSGLDFGAIRAVWTDFEKGGRLRGGSTITQQTAKNLFLWPGRDWLRKGLEAYLALGLELLWPKRRILEVYLNIAEFGPGVYGAEAAALFHFNRPATDLTVRQAALLASVLPNPSVRSASTPSDRELNKAMLLQQRARQIKPLLTCY